MKDNEIIEESNGKIKIRQAFMWHFALVYLDTLIGMDIMNDNKFRSLLEKVYEYVDTKCAIDDEGDVCDIYVVVEQERYKNQNSPQNKGFPC